MDGPCGRFLACWNPCYRRLSGRYFFGEFSATWWTTRVRVRNHPDSMPANRTRRYSGQRRQGMSKGDRDH